MTSRPQNLLKSLRLKDGLFRLTVLAAERFGESAAFLRGRVCVSDGRGSLLIRPEGACTRKLVEPLGGRSAVPATSQHGLDGDRLDGERASKYRAGVGI